MNKNKDPLREAARLLNEQAPEGESLAYINQQEADALKRMGGAGKPVNSSGVPSYFIDKIADALGFGADAPPGYEGFDPGEAAREYVDAMSDAGMQDQMLNLRRQYDPQYQDLQLDLAERAMDPMARMAERSALRQQDFGNRMADRQASSDIDLINRYGRDLQDTYRATDPLMQARTDQANQLAELAYQDAQMTDLSPEMRRRATQSARETLAATGRSSDNAGIAAEAMSREDYLRDILRQNRKDFQEYNTRAASLNQATRVDPLRLLGGGDRYTQRGYGERAAMFGIPQESVTRINPDAGVNIGMAENANRNNYNASTYSAHQQAKSGALEGFVNVAPKLMPLLGGLAGGALGALGGLAGGVPGMGGLGQSLTGMGSGLSQGLGGPGISMPQFGGGFVPQSSISR